MSIARLPLLAPLLAAACGSSTIIEPSGTTSQIPGTAPTDSACVAAARVPFAQGTMIYTAQLHDLAIEGRGFFVVDRDGRRYYTREGSFFWGNTGHLRRADGSELMVSAPGDRPGELHPTALAWLLRPESTTAIEIHANLDARAEAPAAYNAVSPSKTSNYTVQLTIYDSLGIVHVINVYFRYTGGAHTWEWHTLVDGGEVTGGTRGDNTEIANGTLVFDEGGALFAATTIASSANFLGAEQNQAITYDFGSLTSAGGTGRDGTTQYGADYDLSWTSQNGYAASQLRSLSFDEQGLLRMAYSDGRSLIAGRVPLVRFDLPSTVTEMGDHRVAASPCSGPAQLVWPGEYDAGWLLPGFVELR